MTTVDATAAALQTLRRVVLGLIGLVSLVAAGVILLALHILGRQHLADQRNAHAAAVAENNRQAVCAVLNSIPPGRRNGPVRQARRLDHCENVTTPQPHLQTTPSPSSPPRSLPTFVVVPVPPAPGRPGRSGPSPRPQRSPEPSTSPTPQPSPTDTPTPTPSPTCDLLHPLRCVQLPH